MNKKYLGDGVYAEQDPDDVATLILTTENGIGKTNRIVLEVEVLNRLMIYLGMSRIGWISEEEPK